MASTYITKGFFLSGTANLDIYTCPVGKRAVVKQIAIQNETNLPTYVTVVWKDYDGNPYSLGTTLGVTTTIPQFTIVNSGEVTSTGRIHAIDDFLALNENDTISCRATDGMRLSVILSALEQELNV